MPSLHSISDFLHPLWKKSFDKDHSNKFSGMTYGRANREKITYYDANTNKITYPDGFGEKSVLDTNRAILGAIDTQLKSVEEKTVESKIQHYLDSATNEYLDYFGSWFGLHRDNDENDFYYRNRIINHIKHPRNTIGALRTQLAKYLKTLVTNITIYEPWMDVLLLNDSASKTNSKSNMYGTYYHPAIIEITISTQFDPQVIDIVNWFRPAGVIYVLQYSSALDPDVAQIWKFPPVDLGALEQALTNDILVSNNKYDNYTLTLNDKLTTSSDTLFELNNSDLDSKDVLSGSKDIGRDYYNYLSFSNGLINPSKRETIPQFLNKTIPILKDNYESTVPVDGKNLSVSITPFKDNYLNYVEDTYSLSNWKTNKEINYENIKPSYVQGDKDVQLYLDLSNGINLNDIFKATLSVYSDNDISNCEYTVTILGTNGEKVTSQDSFSLSKGTNYLTLPNMSIDFEVNYINFTVQADNNVIKIEKPFLTTLDTNDAIKWTPSLKDFNQSNLDSNEEDVYVAFDIKKYFINNIDSLGDIVSKLPDNYTNVQLNRYIDGYLVNKIVNSAISVTDDAKVSLVIYNFNTGNYETIDNSKSIINYKIANLADYLSDNGVLILAYRCPLTSNVYDLGIDEITIEVSHVNIKDYINMDTSGIEKEQNIGIDYHLDNIDLGSQPDFRYIHKVHKPIRYIRNYIKGIYTKDSSKGSKANYLSLGDSYSGPYTDNYTDYSIIPTKINNYPVVSLSMLGIVLDGQTNRSNGLGNLIQGGIFTDAFYYDYSGDDLITNQPHYDTIDWSNAKIGIKPNNTVTFQSDQITTSEKYIFTINADGDVSIEIHGVSGDNTDKLIESTIDKKGNTISVKFDTLDYYPKMVKIIVRGLKTPYTSIDSPFLGIGSLDVKADNTEASLPNVLPSYDDNYWHYIINAQPHSMVTYQWKFSNTYRNNSAKLYYSSTGLAFDDTQKLGDTFNIAEQSLADFAYLYGRNELYKQEYLNWENEIDVDTRLAKLNNSAKLYYSNKVFATLEPYSDVGLTFDDTQKSGDTFDIAEQSLADFGYLYKHNELYKREYLNWKNGIDVNAPLARLSEPADTEHSFTVDLGKTHNDIKSIYLHHGSDSLTDVTYQSCVQVSEDGNVWDTVYDNYKFREDDMYIEPTGSPAYFDISSYDENANTNGYINAPTKYQDLQSDETTYRMLKDSAITYRDLQTKTHPRNTKAFDFGDLSYTLPKDFTGYPFNNYGYNISLPKTLSAGINTIAMLSNSILGNTIRVDLGISSDIYISDVEVIIQDSDGYSWNRTIDISKGYENKHLIFSLFGGSNINTVVSLEVNMPKVRGNVVISGILIHEGISYSPYKATTN